VAPLRRLYESRVPGFADFCCYWFEKARAQIASKHAHRAGLLATQGIRGGLNRVVLARIKTTGDIFFAESDRKWVLDGAAVHVSMVGFDDGTEAQRTLDGRRVDSINSNLTHNTDVTRAKRLVENARIGFVADVKAGAFDIPDTKAAEFLNAARNPNGRPNSDVIRPWVNGLDLTRRPRGMWIIDFPPTMTVGEAAMYEQPFEYVRDHVKPLRDKSNRETYKTRWWVHAEPVVAMRSQLNPLSRFIVTPTLTKHRLFAWLTMPTLPDHQLVAFARQDDYFFGVLHSHAHEVWALAQGTQLETRPRYTPTSCFETFPLPWPPGREPKGELVVTEIAAAAAELDKLRNGWLNPPGLPQEELKARTLTNLYNLRPTWLDNAHKRLDRAVFAAYGWPDELTDQEILARLLELNLKRSGA
jgi:type II restriction/modification system DNA methylase subunit YeeA